MQKIIALHDHAFALVAKAKPWVILLSRISLGVVFLQSGWGKLHNLEKVTEYFTSLGVPAPQIQAPFVASVELVCGALVLLGLLTRLAAIPLIVTMLVAIATAKKAELESVSDLFGLIEYLYIVLFLYLIVEGAGAISLDALVRRRVR
jgi:putative oxidoreductase